ncbi:response regulator [Flavobacterium sp. H122]|uniref:response regulator n=1 Tax=Flavobacterium sp. H122 TaxID=2529860 RepID=UPI0010AB1AD4|nr:response regulator [Flavobacterium sp. H122]
MRCNHTFLLIEDNSIDQLITSKLINRITGTHEINIVENGREAIKWISYNRIDFDKSLIILLDINMPEMNGFQFLNEFESLPENLKKETQIFMLSSTLNNDDIEKIKNSARVKTLLEKPLSIQKLEQFI